jgi:hypothetical protein
MSSVLSAVLVVNESGEKLYIWYDELPCPFSPIRVDGEPLARLIRSAGRSLA